MHRKRNLVFIELLTGINGEINMYPITKFNAVILSCCFVITLLFSFLGPTGIIFGTAFFMLNYCFATMPPTVLGMRVVEVFCSFYLAFILWFVIVCFIDGLLVVGFLVFLPCFCVPVWVLLWGRFSLVKQFFDV